jgi:transposase InsO family protein
MLANVVWGLDLTGKRDRQGHDHSILGIIDHGSRFAVSLSVLRNRATITILRIVLDAIERRWSVEGFEELTLALGDFRAWYNHVRPHQHLAGRTPFEAWSGIDPYASAPKQVRYSSAWDGMLTGYWIRR